MKKIIRGSGFTASERYLQQLSDRTFLQLWTYPNTFNDRNKSANGDGKEICDLLVVCGDDVIIVSDKSIAWPKGDLLGLQWSRWYRRAIASSVEQIRGAERWLRDYPDRVFLDAKCIQGLPVHLPPIGRRRVHCIAIVRGANEACSKFCDGDEGSLMIVAGLKGDAHTDSLRPDWTPFAIGDVDPVGSFVHVFDEIGLDRVMSEMDTIADFIEYLDARATAIREEHLLACAGESDLLAYYMQTDDPSDRPRFLEVMAKASGCDQVTFAPGAYEDFVASAAYARKKVANLVSYRWDWLIGEFSRHVMDGTSVSILDELPSFVHAELALRIMAKENRLRRRRLASGLSEAIREACNRSENRFARIVLPGMAVGYAPEPAYVFLLFEQSETAQSEDSYRRARASLLMTYCLAVLQENRRIKLVVGIAMTKPTDKSGSSEDLLAVEISEWTPEIDEEVTRRRSVQEVLVRNRLVVRHDQDWEYPPANTQQT